MTDRATPPSTTADTDLWTSVDDLHTWLDTNRPVDGSEGLLLRILKLSEEVGEVAQAVIGATGQNPRKGLTHTWDDVQSELCDVVITALVALRTLTPEAREVFARHLAGVTERSMAATRPHNHPIERGTSDSAAPAEPVP
ncbi:MazG-like family protein [Streptomyces sp. NBC_00289]|uniref:MazG-like family protein n=1 Tax=Streptomyces sp. NBC_00289 TaxID=2975703 RepID=UPI00324B823A